MDRRKALLYGRNEKITIAFQRKGKFLVEHFCLKKFFLHSWGTCTTGTSSREAAVNSGLRSQIDTCFKPTLSYVHLINRYIKEIV